MYQDQIIDLVWEDAQILECTDEILHLRYIIENGTSATRQLKTFNQAILKGEDHNTALSSVVDMLISETSNATPARDHS